MNEGLFMEGNGHWHGIHCRSVVTAPSLLKSDPSNHRDTGSCRRLIAAGSSQAWTGKLLLLLRVKHMYMWGLHRCNCGQIKDKKRTPTDFLQNSYQGSFSVRATIEAEDSLNSLHTKLHLPLQKHLTDRVLNERVLSVSHQKKEKRKSFRFRWQKWDFWVSHNCWQAREKGTSKEHLAPLAHIGGERWLSKQNNITCCETAPLYAEPH